MCASEKGLFVEFILFINVYLFMNHEFVYTIIGQYDNVTGVIKKKEVYPYTIILS